MPLTVLIAIGIIGIFLMLRSQPTQPPAPNSSAQDGDAATLDELAHAGSDLTREHNIEFYLYVPQESDAQDIAAQLRAEGLAVEITRASDDSSWLCLVQRRMIPDMAGLRSCRERFTALAEHHDGEYDGWGTEVEGG